MPLTTLLFYGTRVADLSPLQGMNVTDIRFTVKNITKGMDVLRQMGSLKVIGVEYKTSWPAAEFWKRYDAGEFNK